MERAILLTRSTWLRRLINSQIQNRFRLIPERCRQFHCFQRHCRKMWHKGHPSHPHLATLWSSHPPFLLKRRTVCLSMTIKLTAYFNIFPTWLLPGKILQIYYYQYLNVHAKTVWSHRLRLCNWNEWKSVLLCKNLHWVHTWYYS